MVAEVPGPQDAPGVECGADLERTRLEPGGERKGGGKGRGQDPGPAGGGETAEAASLQGAPSLPGKRHISLSLFQAKGFYGPLDTFWSYSSVSPEGSLCIRLQSRKINTKLQAK